MQMIVRVDLDRRVATVESGGIEFRADFNPDTGRLIGKIRKNRVGLGRDESSTWVPDAEFRKVVRTMAAAAQDHVARAKKKRRAA